MTENLLREFINSHTYDIRITGNGRWIDQKCAFDTVCFVADCVVDYLRNGGTQPFTSPQIWHMEYSMRFVREVFSKPDPTLRSTLDEYNKFFRQPLKMLSAAGVLSERTEGSTIYFRVENMDVLEYIALRERNALEFMWLYIEKTLKDSHLWDSFESFFDMQTPEWFDEVKERFERFCKQYTPINTNIEANRIFTKVLNQLAFKYKKHGTIRGRFSNRVITLHDITYNKANWFDELMGKEKHIARSDFNRNETPNETSDYQLERAKRNLKHFIDTYCNGEPEVRDKFSIGHKASAYHHIFPRSRFPQLATYYENMIALTTAQHMQEAHPGGNTRIVDKDFQHKCLIAKTDSIHRNLLGEDHAPAFYEFDSFMYVLDEGLQTDYFQHLPQENFDAVLEGIEINFPRET